MLKSDTNGKQPFTLTVKGDGYAAYIFRREMEKQLAIMPLLSKEDYYIKITLEGSQNAATIAQDSTVSRVNLTYSANYEIARKDKATILQSSSITASYPVVIRDEFISRSADFSATSRIMISLAQEVALEIAHNIKQEIDRQAKI